MPREDIPYNQEGTIFKLKMPKGATFQLKGTAVYLAYVNTVDAFSFISISESAWGIFFFLVFLTNIRLKLSTHANKA